MSTASAANGDFPSEEALLKTEVADDNTNKNTLRCLRCNCKILKPTLGSHKQIKFDLPEMRKKQDSNKTESSEIENESLNHFWLVEDMYAFENIGFCNPVANVKYLACADCEVGPIGWSDMEAKKIYVALNRVKYVT